MKKMSIVCCILLTISLVVSCADRKEMYNSSKEKDSASLCIEGDLKEKTSIESIEQPKNLEEEAVEGSNVLNDNLEEETMIDSSKQSDYLGDETMQNSNITVENSEEKGITNSKYTLIVQGQDITQGNYVNFCENPKYVALPFTAVMKALGAKIQQKSENIIELNFNSETFVLDTKAVTLVKAESSTNFIIPAPGSKVYYKIVENEFVIDNITFNTIAMMMGVKLKVDINYQQHIVEIDYQ